MYLNIKLVWLLPYHLLVIGNINIVPTTDLSISTSVRQKLSHSHMENLYLRDIFQLSDLFTTVFWIYLNSLQFTVIFIYIYM